MPVALYLSIAAIAFLLIVGPRAYLLLSSTIVFGSERYDRCLLLANRARLIGWIILIVNAVANFFLHQHS